MQDGKKNQIKRRYFGLQQLLKVSRDGAFMNLQYLFVEIESEETAWYQKLNNDGGSPFVIFGDMETFKPPERRMTLQRVKAAKTAPRKWKEYGKVTKFI